VVTDADQRAALARASGFAGLVVQRHVLQAPVLIALCGDAHLSSWYVHDCCLASQNLMLAATALGLGTCWIGAFSEEKAREVLGLPAEIRVVGIITMGYPVRALTRPTLRLPLHDVVHWESFDMPGRHGPGARSVGRSGLLSLWREALDLLGLGHR
jgi:nitroreductase